MGNVLLDDYIVVTIVGICLCLGYVIKTSFSFIPNKYIPLIMMVVGTAANIFTHVHDITLQVILSGMVSGLASTGGYEAVHQMIKNYGNQMGTEGIEGADDELENSGEEDDDDASN